MQLNVILRGKSKETLELMIQSGYANTLSEAIRLAIIHFGKEHFSEENLGRLEKHLKEGKALAVREDEHARDYLKHLT